MPIGAFGTPEGIRTPDLLVRSQTLYPTELRAHIRTKAYNKALSALTVYHKRTALSTLICNNTG